MGTRAGWRWISVVVVGCRFPVRLSLRPARHVLQDKRRRVRIAARYSVVGFLFQFGSMDDLDLAENLCDRRRTSFIKSAVEQYRRETTETRLKHQDAYFSTDLCIWKGFLYIYIFSFVKVFSTTSCNLWLSMRVIPYHWRWIALTALVNKFWLVRLVPLSRL